MAEDVVKFDDNSMKMEIDVEDENIADWAQEESISDNLDPLLKLSQKPIVFTTKLDDMNTVTQDLTDVSAKEIITKMQSESKPIHTQRSKLRSNTVNIESFKKLTKVVNQINNKAAIEEHNIYARNMYLLSQCKPLSIELKDIKSKLLETSLQNSNHSEIALNGSSNNIIKVKNEVETVNFVATELLEPDFEKIFFSNRTNGVKQIENEISDSEKYEESPITKVNASNAVYNKDSCIVNKKFKSQRDSTSNESLYKDSNIKKKSKKLVVKPNSTSDEDNDTPLIHFKTKSSAEIQAKAPVKRTALIVLVHDNKKAFVYRINTAKLVTDCYVMDRFDITILAIKYPRLEKIIVRYCCWVKREESISNICMLKGYPFTIQKFLREPHMCPLDNCLCCCRNHQIGDLNKESQEQKSCSVQNSLTVADSWIRGLLKRKKPNDCQSLIATALSYIPKKEPKEKLPIEPKRYLEFVVICIKYSGTKKNAYKNVSEFYEVGKNGNITGFLKIDGEKKEKEIRKMYSTMNHLNLIEVSYCCWCKRDKIVDNLKKSEMSPSVLKLMQMSHHCQRNLCKCCCKAKRVVLKAIEALPTVFKHTIGYDRTVRPLTVKLNATSKYQTQINEKTVDKVPNNTTDAIEAATIILPSCAFEGDNQNLNISALLNKLMKLKLGVTSDGKLETILDIPARNLSIAELEVLYNVLEFSTKQMIELGLSPKEFCNRINSRSGQPNHTAVVPEKISLSVVKNAPSSLKMVNDSTTERNDVGKNLPIQISAVIIDNVGYINNARVERSSITQNTQSSEILRKTLTSFASSEKTFKYMSSLMETKNKNYVDSFKRFFKNISGPLQPERSTIIQKDTILTETNTNDPSLPKIAETFSLKSTNIVLAIPGSSGITRQPQQKPPLEAKTSKPAVVKQSRNIVNPMTTLNSTMVPSENLIKIRPKNTSVAIEKRKAPAIENSQNEKKIRVKSAMELMNTNSITNRAVLETPTIPFWPAPILIKQDPVSNITSIVNSFDSAAVQINPLHSQAYVCKGNVTSSNNANLGIVNAPATISKVYHVKGNSVTKISSPTVNYSINTGVRYLTLEPLTQSDSIVDATMIHQTQKTSFIQTTANVPPLVPIKIANRKPELDDIENSIGYCVIIDNKQNDCT